MSLFNTLAALRQAGTRQARTLRGNIGASVNATFGALGRTGLMDGIEDPDALRVQVINEAENFRRLRQIRNPNLRPTEAKTMLPKELKSGDKYAYVVTFTAEVDGSLEQRGRYIYRNERLSMADILSEASAQVLETVGSGMTSGISTNEGVGNFEVAQAYYNPTR